MKTVRCKRIAAFLLIFSFLFACAPVAIAADTDGFRCSKTAEYREDGTVGISLRAFQTGSVPAADIVMVLDVSGSMENSTPVPVSEIDSTKDYYIRYVRIVVVDGEQKNMRVNVRVHNISDPGEEPVWVGKPEDDKPERQFTPGDGTNGTYRFYTGAMSALRAAATDFVHSIAQNAVQYGADHRIAVVEFSSPAAKGADALCTHSTQPDPYYANILTGTQTASGALVSAKDGEQALADVFASLSAAGPTYSDDAMTQAQRILSASTASRRVAILFTDGGPGSYGWDYDNDETSFSTANGAIGAAAAMKQSGVQIYTIGVFNEENLAGTAGENNRTYLSLVSSNYPDAESMDISGTQQADGYCSIGDLHMDLSGAFAGISAVLGEPVESAQVRDTVSKYFFLTDAQRQALAEAYPNVQIMDNEDGSTTVSLDEVDFPPVAVQADGEVADENDSGIFTMTFDVTPREGFLGGSGVATNSGLCGVFAEGVQIAQFTAPTVDVPVNDSALDDLLNVSGQTIYTNQTLSADMLFTDLSQSALAEYAEISYSVTDPDGEAFTAGSLPAAGIYPFVVTMRAVIGGKTYTRQKTAEVNVLEDSAEELRIVTLPEKTQYYLGESVSLDGVAVEAFMRSGRTVNPTVQQLSVSPETLNSVGTQTITLSFGGASTSFDVTVEPYAPTLSIQSLPDKTSYFVGESLDLTGLRLVYTDEYNTPHTVDAGFSCEPASLSVPGTQKVTVTYCGISATFNVMVETVVPVSLTVVTPPRSTTFIYRHTPDFGGLSVCVLYNDGHDEIVDDLAQMNVRADSDARVRRGVQTFRVTARGVSATFTMQVRLVWWQWLILIFLFGWIWY